jgi:4-hydroxy-tetrahydrodipicolinate synthase
MQFDGVFSVLPTPFDETGELDEASLRRVVRLYVNAGVNGVTALGVTSEVTRLEHDERARVLDIVLGEIGGRVPVVCGATADGTRACVAYSRDAVRAGAAGVMVSPPRMPKLNSDAVVRHFQTLADSVDVEIIVQDFPPVSGYAMEPALLARVAAAVPRARTIKLEDPPTPLKIARIREASGANQVRIFGGLGGVFLLEELLAGATGTMTGAADVFYATVPLMRFEFQEGIGMAIRKEVLRRRGAVAAASIRPPGGQLDDSTRAALDRVLAWVSARYGGRLA